MIYWIKSDEASCDRAGFVQWYLCDGEPRQIVGEVILASVAADTYYAELMNGRGLRYFTDVNTAKDWLWTFYHLERAS